MRWSASKLAKLFATISDPEARFNIASYSVIALSYSPLSSQNRQRSSKSSGRCLVSQRGMVRPSPSFHIVLSYLQPERGLITGPCFFAVSIAVR